jgi:Holliday junction resolvase RusA-like endonuclease
VTDLFVRPVEGNVTLTFCVWGNPEPAGSKRALPMKGAPGRFVVIDDNPKSGAWKRQVAAVARHIRLRTGYPLLEEAVAMRLTFIRERPKSHYRADGRLRPGAPDYPVTRPDATKLLRAVEDALTGVLYSDDAAIVAQSVSKVYGAQPGVEISIWNMPPSSAATSWPPKSREAP